MNKNVFLALWLLLPFGLHAQNVNKAKLDSLFTAIESSEKGMGSISLFKDGKEVYQRSIGFADVEANVKNTGATKFRIGSVSKTFTAAIIMQMVDQKKLSLDTKLATFFPQVPNADKITIEHLLRHRSGIFNITNDPDYLNYLHKSHTEDELVAKIIAKGSVFEPGAQTQYSNSGYILLSYIAEKVDKKSFANVVRDRIVKPLKLENTYVGGKLNATRNEAKSYTREGRWKLATETDMSIPLGAGAIVSTATELNIFYTNLMEGKLVSASSLDAMKTLNDKIGMGLVQMPFHDKPGFGHMGGIDGFINMAVYMPTEKLTIAYTSNGVNVPINDIMLGATQIYLGMPYKIPAYKLITLSAEDLAPLVGVYSSPSFPLKITITANNNVLIAQATGQPSFPLEAEDKHIFKFDRAMLTLEFKPEVNSMILKQGPGTYELKKE
jgi:D-alanyl-D-alanine carboxypeptidase